MTAAQDQSQKDHDLLIEINTKLSLFMEMFTSHKKDTDNEIAQIKKDVAELKEGRIKDAGFQAGKKASFAIIAAVVGSLPPSAFLIFEKLI